MNTDEQGGGRDSAEPHSGRAPEPVPSFGEVNTGPGAHGFGSLADGRDFAFEVRGRTLRVEIYRAGRRTPVPDPADAVAAAEAPAGDVDLDDRRSVTALVADTLSEALRSGTDAGGTHPVRALLSKLGSVFDAI